MALTHDWLNSFGGAERVLAELLRIFPGAPIYTSVYDPAGLPEAARGWDVRPSFMQRVPFARRRHRAFLPLMPFAFESFDLSDYDVILTTASAFAKGVVAPAETRVLCYCYTPPRYLWDQYHAQTRRMRGRVFVAAAAHYLRLWDRVAADRVDTFVAISETVARRIRAYYRRDAMVVYPPVDTDRWVPDGRAPDDFLLTVARLVPYKRIDLAVQAAERLGRPLVVVGDGPERGRLEAMAGRHTRFLGWQPDEVIAGLYARARAFVFPGVDDFGIAPLEAHAAGRPVVAYGRGGALETVVHGVTGLHFADQTVESLAEAIEAVYARDFDPAVCRARALAFSAPRFRARMAELVYGAEGADSATRPSASAVTPVSAGRAGAPLADVLASV